MHLRSVERERERELVTCNHDGGGPRISIFFPASPFQTLAPSVVALIGRGLHAHQRAQLDSFAGAWLVCAPVVALSRTERRAR